MITIKNVHTLDGLKKVIEIPSRRDQTLDARGLFLFPGIIDSHIGCGTPEQKQWQFAIESAIRGGVTTLIDIPYEARPSATKNDLEIKKEQVENRLLELGIPLRFFLYGKGNSSHVEDMGLEKQLILGSLIILSSEEEELDDETWNRIFQLAAWEDFPVIINSRNENSWRTQENRSHGTLLDKAIHYAEKQNTRLYVLNVSTQQELDQIEDARRKSLLVYAETTAQHLLPFSGSNVDFLWEAVIHGVVEILGSGYFVDQKNGQSIRFQGREYDFLNPMFFFPYFSQNILKAKSRLKPSFVPHASISMIS